MGYYGGNRDADRPVTDLAGEVLHDVSDDRRHIPRRRLLGSGDPESLGGELAGFQVDGSSFDAAAADVDAEYGCASYRFFAHAGEPSDIRPLRGGGLRPWHLAQDLIRTS